MARDLKAIASELQVVRAQGGDERAFRALVESWSPHLVRFCRRRTDDPDTTRDVVQAIWLQVVKGLRRLEDPARFPAWLFTIAVRTCADQVKEQVSRRALAADYWDVVLNVGDDRAPETTASFLDLKIAIDALSSEQKQLLGLYYKHGYTVEEIAVRLNVPGGTVKSRLHSLRERLRGIRDGAVQVNTGDRDENH